MQGNQNQTVHYQMSLSNEKEITLFHFELLSDIHSSYSNQVALHQVSMKLGLTVKNEFETCVAVGNQFERLQFQAL